MGPEFGRSSAQVGWRGDGVGCVWQVVGMGFGGTPAVLLAPNVA